MTRFEPHAHRPGMRPERNPLPPARGLSGGLPAHQHRLPVLVLTLALAGCAMAPPQTVSTEFPVLAPSTLGTAHSARQLLQAAFDEHDLAFQCVVDAHPDSLAVVGLDALGQRWFSLHHDGRTLESRLSPQAPAQLNPRRILADMQLALWPLAALQQALAGSTWQVTEPAPATRRLRRDGRLVAEVHYADADPWRGQLWLSNFETGYTLSVESRPLQ
ncbi:MAG: DUF3261 domain-containing protein [Immundisolibacter sp.]|uniref:DUF3261 domain-containing protein n=1 Tax=Immundisolibacter sp. TaxID=1934948 RepID=UPI003EE3E443